ncbi:Matrix metalloproteinase [Aphelenchoides bicaudatus]|nr:Matrix metalloproteinase [Aphelenchoides bicaudatus]
MLQTRGFLIFSILCTSFVGGCFSSGTTKKYEPTKTMDKEAEALALELKDNSIHMPQKADLSSDEKLQKAYLDSFGYTSAIRHESSKRPGSVDEEALKEFQRFMNINPAGSMNPMARAQIKSAMLRKRCSNADLPSEERSKKLWEKTTITYRIVSYPIGLNASDVKELIAQAFRAWEIVIALDFVEARRELPLEEVDIVFEFSDRSVLNKNDKTGFAVCGATGPVNSRIWIKQSERWGTFQVQEPGRLDIFLTIVHEIGHVLGLPHSTDQSSVMFPIIQRQPGEELPVINSDDVEKLRNLYDPQNEVIESIPDTGVSTDNQHEDCPSALWTITQTPSGRYVLFVDDLVYQFDKDRKQIGSGPVKIQKLFPNAPQKVAVAVSNGERMALIEERIVFEYVEDEATGRFRLVNGYPKRLHSMVLFYPSIGFPLSNGSVILIDGGVFATYSLELNSPSFLNDKNIYFPGLPEGLRSGIIDKSNPNGNLYDMFTSDSVHKYDVYRKEVISVKPLRSFVRCK